MSDNERQLIGISKIARQKIIDQLKHAYAQDHLEEIDFERRLDIATNTSDRSILRELVDDLSGSSDESTAASPTAPASFHIGTQGVESDGTIMSIFGGVTRKGDWHPPRRLKIVSALGGVDLDFTNATIPAEGIQIDVFCVMGGIDLRVPEGINVDAHPVTILGGSDTHGTGFFGKDAPTIRVRGLIIMGALDVKPPRKNRFRKFLKKMFTDD
jgi:hypothetical protein